MIDPDETVSFDPAEMFNLKPHWWTEDEDEDDWRNDY